MAYIIYHALKKIEHISEIANAGIVFGGSSGPELNLGRFSNGVYVKDIRINENGDYDKLSTCHPKKDIKLFARGELWDYLMLSYKTLIEEYDLYYRLSHGGEEEAINIINKFSNTIYINRCTICNNLKKTPRARLCLKCRMMT